VLKKVWVRDFTHAITFEPVMLESQSKVLKTWIAV